MALATVTALPTRRPISDTGPSKATRRALWDRADGRCEVCGSTFALQAHHRRPRGAGGSRARDTNGLANLLLLCAASHLTVELNRANSL
ncbi:MAG TPA: HNH endonuclease signature motif containing protein, partial [Streptosporangiales bacterium]